MSVCALPASFVVWPDNCGLAQNRLFNLAAILLSGVSVAVILRDHLIILIIVQTIYGIATQCAMKLPQTRKYV